MILKSHTEKEILAAYDAGKSVWELDTNIDGDDDVLIGSFDEVVSDLLDWLNTADRAYPNEFSELPDHWHLREIPKNEFVER